MSWLTDPYKYPTFKQNYEFGFPQYKKDQPVVIQFRPEGVRFQFFGMFDGKKILIPHHDIIEVSLNQEVYRSSGKAAVGAIVGGLLTGGLGLIAGAAFGGKRRKENQLTLIIRYNGEERDIELTPNKDTEKIYRELKNVIITPVEVKKVPEIASANSSVADELEKLSSLRDRGILTEDEYTSQKLKLLN